MAVDEPLAQRIAERIAGLPTGPGVYLMKSARGKVLYVGKAQNLRTRVRSYWNSGGDGRIQIPKLVARVVDVGVLVTPTVKDALLLENELIKQHKPPFNVRLRDDKQYLALRLDPRDDWPRLTMVRRFKRDGAQYFGPYTSSSGMKHSLSNLRRIFPLRTCSDGVFKDYARRGRPCIEFEIGRCPGPCCDKVSEETYRELLRGTELFLRGRSAELVKALERRMQDAALEERFEDAARLRDRIQAVEHTVERQQIVSDRQVDRDVFGLARTGGEALVQVLHVREGRVIGSAEYPFSDVRIEDGDVMSSFLGQYYGLDHERQVPAEVLASASAGDEPALEALLCERAGRKVTVRVPKRGAGRELVAMAMKNAEVALAQRIHNRESVEAALVELKEKLFLSELPRRIECYDVSNLQGTLAVASRVTFNDGLPDKSGYRRYRIKDAPAGDDLACMREVIARRFERIAKEPLPDLLVVDGGRGQLAVVTALARDTELVLDHVGIAKERDTESPSERVKRSGGLKAERLFLPNRVNPVLLLPSSRGLLLLQRVRDEAHRFAIEFQRSLRQKIGLTSILEEIPGIGPGKRRALLRELGSLRQIRDAEPETLEAVSGVSRKDARRIHGFFRAVASLDERGEVPVEEEFRE
ncbi:MAG: excinuclease ABC subunit UvrC [Deltaproteobacteria bacterium]|nr:excinuclease ABC subunit UvrC [Deltaproteobacteria bacterium]MBW2397234.1 excinuclease ABC subunit UvrC [Deltaproteobacteria bacterium]